MIQANWKIQLWFKWVMSHSVDFRNSWHINETVNPSAWGHLKPSSYCGVGRFSTRYLNLELNCAGVYSK